MRDDEQNCAPVLLLNFNRPEFTRRQISCLRNIRPARVFFAVDGPRKDRPYEAERVAEVRKQVSSIDWPCDVKTLFQAENLGCKYAPPAAITWFFNNVEEGIVLEDDIVASDRFFRFATELLLKYRNDMRIGAVCGFSRYNYQTNKDETYHFTRHLEIWGWATWRRAWKHYEVDMASYLPCKDELVDKCFLTPRVKRAFLKGIEAVETGLQTWDYQLSLAFLARGYLSIHPRERLTINGGIGDKNATHTGNYCFDNHHFVHLGDIGEGIKDPADISQDDAAVFLEERRSFGILPRILTYAGSKFRFMAPLCDLIGIPLERIAPRLFRL